MTELGEAHVIAYLTDVTDEQINSLASVICDWARSAGLCSDEYVRVVVGIKPREFPDLAGDASAFFDEHAAFFLPDSDDEMDAEALAIHADLVETSYRTLPDEDDYTAEDGRYDNASMHWGEQGRGGL
jgi:hypothetical protein